MCMLVPEEVREGIGFFGVSAMVVLDHHVGAGPLTGTPLSPRREELLAAGVALQPQTFTCSATYSCLTGR